jgi:N-acetylmuramoyl-L-alanine amidase
MGFRGRWVLVQWLAVALLCGLLMACDGGADAGPADPSQTVESDPRPGTVTVTQPPGTPTATFQPTVTATPMLSQPTAPVPSPTPTAAPPRPTASATLTPTPPAAESDDDAPVIVLDPGHDVTRPGALGVEYQDTLRTAVFAKAALGAAGYRVYLTRSDNDYVFVDDPALLPPNGADFPPGFSHAYAHATKALQFEPDMIIQLHFNGHSDPSVGRLEVYYCELGGSQNLVLAEIVAEELRAALRALGHEPQAMQVAEDLGVARGNRHFPSLGNLYDAPREHRGNRYAGIPVVLTEPLYETNPVQRALILDDATHVALAEAYVRAANRYFGR